MKCVSIFLGRALVLLTLCAIFILQRVYQEPLLSGVRATNESLRNGNGFTKSPIAPSQFDSAVISSTAPVIAHTIIPSARPSALPSSVKPQGDISSSIFSYLDCGTKPSNPDLLEVASKYVKNIINHTFESTTQLNCPAINATRYSVLSQLKTFPLKPRYFFALDLHQSAHIIEQLLGSVVEAIRFLGPNNCVLSVVEGRSTDGTYELLRDLRQEMKLLGVEYHLQCIELDPKDADSDRILTLALLRNHALQPLTERPDRYEISTRIVFLNDVALCAEDILELVYQSKILNADMTCAVDWYDDHFYDVWIGRSMIGDLFFEIPQSQSFEFATNLFWNHEASRTSYTEGRPFQVFSCWNGAVAMIAKPFLEKKIEFRSSFENECRLGEPVHLCKDLWKLGYGKIAVVPSVNVGYRLESTVKAKEQHGTVSSWIARHHGRQDRVQWIEQPPPQIKCMVDWSHPSWVPWDQGLVYVEGLDMDISPP